MKPRPAIVERGFEGDATSGQMRRSIDFDATVPGSRGNGVGDCENLAILYPVLP